jgi:hypothetical protein
MNFCGMCGTRLAAQARFCANCGSPVAAIPEPIQSGNEPVSPYGASQSGQQLRTSAVSWDSEPDSAGSSVPAHATPGAPTETTVAPMQALHGTASHVTPSPTPAAPPPSGPAKVSSFQVRAKLMRKRAVVAGAVAVIAVAGVAVAVAIHTSRSASAQASVDAQHGGSVELGGARLSVSPGAVSGQGHLTASASGAPSVSGSVAAGMAQVAGSVPVRFQMTGAGIAGPLVITFRVGTVAMPSGASAAGSTAAVWLAFYDPVAQLWRPVSSHYDAAAGIVTAQISHLSWWAPFTWDWQGVALRLRQSLSGLGGGRAAAVNCPGVPQVTVTSAGGQDPPLVGCAATAGHDSLTISITNNRGVSMVMSGVPPDATQDRPSYQGFGEYLMTQGITTQVVGGADLPPSETLTYSLPLRGPTAVFTASPTLGSYALDLANMISGAVLTETKFSGLSGSYITCTLNAIARREPATLVDAESLAESCLPTLAKAIPALEGLTGATVNLIIADVRLVLQDFDLANDAIRGVSGRVSIARPLGAPSATPLTQASAEMRAVTSAHVTIDVAGAVAGTPLRRAAFDVTRDGDATGTFELNQFDVLTMDAFVIVDDVLYIKGATGGWQRLGASTSFSYPSAFLTPDRGVIRAIASATNARSKGTTTIDGQSTDLITARLNAAAAYALIGTTSTSPSATVPGSLWIDPTTKRLRRMVFTAPAAAGGPPVAVTIDVTNTDEPLSISAP